MLNMPYIVGRAFIEKCVAKAKLESAAKAIADGKGTYTLADEYAYEVGDALAETLAEVLGAAGDGGLTRGQSEELLRPVVREAHDMVAAVSAQVQTTLNKQAGIGLKAQSVPMDEDRVAGLVTVASNAETYADAAAALANPVVGYAQFVVMDTLRANIEFQGKAGLRPRIIRKAESRCCKWCTALEGEYSYPDVPKDVYRRHANCRCQVDYDPGDGKSFQNVHTKKWQTAEERDKIETRKQFSAKPDEVSGEIEARKTVGTRSGWDTPRLSEKRSIQQGFEAFPTGDPLKANVRNVAPDGNFFDVGMHGMPKAVCFGTAKPSMDARELARVILRDPNYKQGQGVRLLSCSTGVSLESGEYCVAEQLSNILGAEVKAPNDVLIIHPNGRLEIGHLGMGEFITYTPNQRRRLK